MSEKADGRDSVVMVDIVCNTEPDDEDRGAIGTVGVEVDRKREKSEGRLP